MLGRSNRKLQFLIFFHFLFIYSLLDWSYVLVCSCGGVDRFRSPSFSFSSSTLFRVSNSRCHCSYLFRGFYVGSSYTTTQTKGEHTRSRSGVPCQLKKYISKDTHVKWKVSTSAVQCNSKNKEGKRTTRHNPRGSGTIREGQKTR